MNLTEEERSMTTKATNQLDMSTFVMDIGGYNVRFDICDYLINDYKLHKPFVLPNVAARQKV